jgi:netrin-G3 ligand
VFQTIEYDDGAGAVLRIQPLRAPRDENIYECVAQNSQGEDAVTAKLAIIRGEPPEAHTRGHTRGSRS